MIYCMKIDIDVLKRSCLSYSLSRNMPSHIIENHIKMRFHGIPKLCEKVISFKAIFSEKSPARVHPGSIPLSWYLMELRNNKIDIVLNDRYN